MTLELATAALLIAVPIAFNLAFLDLGRRFDYPNILREPADLILRRFHAGGTALVVRWQMLLGCALGMLPLVSLVAVTFEAPIPLAVLGVLTGSAAAIVQALGLARWPFAVPELARQYVEADGPEGASTRQTVELVFTTLHRLLGVGIGEHLGYLLTGAWTTIVAASLASTASVAPWLAWSGVPIGAALIIGSLEFVGPNESKGWSVAATVVPVAYVAWSLWLIALGISLII